MIDDVAALEHRIASLESKFYIAVVVAIIFGVSGAWGAKLLSDAKKQITKLKRTAGEVSETYKGYERDLKSAEVTAIDHVNNSARDVVKREADAQLTGLTNRIANIHSKWGEPSSKYLLIRRVDRDHSPIQR